MELTNCLDYASSACYFAAGDSLSSSTPTTMFYDKRFVYLSDSKNKDMTFFVGSLEKVQCIIITFSGVGICVNMLSTTPLYMNFTDAYLVEEYFKKKIAFKLTIHCKLKVIGWTVLFRRFLQKRPGTNS